MKKPIGAYLLIGLAALLMAGGCSTKKNTAGTRFYHSLTTRYNVYFNGNEAYKEGMLAIEQGNKDNHLERIPMYPIGNKTTVGTGASSFERAIEKSQKAIRQHSIKRKPTRKPGRRYTDEYKQWLTRKEFNPYLHNAWMLLGKAQFHKGDFPDAIATFAYVARLYKGQPRITAEAEIWLARCYTELKWYYEAEDMLGRVNNDTLPTRLMPFHSATYSNMLLEQERFREALPHLLTAIKHEKRKKLRQRQVYLLGQVYQQLDEKENAYRAYKKVIGMNPPYELELSARIRQTEVMNLRDSEKTVKRLRRMARNGKNKDYLDQVHYAIGNVYLAQADTAKAIDEFKIGAEKSTRAGIEKGMLQLRLGNLLWEQARYEEARQAYADAIALIGNEHPQYALLNKRSEVLDELVTHTSTIQLQDSLQHLASLSEPERVAIIKKMMEEMARKEEEARRAEELQQRREELEASGTPTTPQTTTPTPQMPGAAGGAWYFYNPQVVAQGKAEFERTWGRRKAEDNWRRRNKTVVNLDEFEQVNYDEPQDADPTNPTLPTDSTATPSPGTDGPDINFYLSQIPLTEEAMQESNTLLADALYGLGLVFKDKLEDYARAAQTFGRLTRQFPQYPQLDNVYYNMYLLYARQNKLAEAEQQKNILTSTFPQSRYALILSDPDYRHNAVHGKHLEDSLYANTYTAWQQGNYARVSANAELSAQKYPVGKHRPKFMFLHAMTALQSKDTPAFLAGLKEVVQNYPENEITELAAYILRGMQEGRTLAGTAGASFGSIWERRKQDLTGLPHATDSLPAFSPERHTPHLFILAYEAGTVNENLLLYEVARYNFSNFIIKNFDLEFVHQPGIGMLQVRSFMNFDEALQYFRQLYAGSMAEHLAGLRALVISEENYELLMKYYSFEDYDTFYREEMNPEVVNEVSLDYVDFEEEEE